MMRTFNKYSPLMIAKHVSSFFKGRFVIAEQGTFIFDGGKVVIDDNLSEHQKKIGREVNDIISDFIKASRTVDLHYS